MSKNTTHKDLIASLASELKPVRRLRHPLVRLLPWLGLLVAYLVVIIAYEVARRDWAIKITETEFVLELLLSGSIAVSAALAAGWLSVPDMKGKHWVIVPPVVLASVLLVWIGLQIFLESMIFPGMKWHKCFGESLYIAGIPAISLWFFERRGNTTRPYWMAGMTLLAAGAISWAVMRIVCGSDNISHMFFYHFIPLMILGSLFGLLARRLYRW